MDKVSWKKKKKAKCHPLTHFALMALARKNFYKPLFAIPRGQSYAAYTLNGGWFIAGGYDGTTIYPEVPEFNSTLKLVNDEYFEERASVSYSSS